MAEALVLFTLADLADKDSLCDACYAQFLVWFHRLTPQEHARLRAKAAARGGLR
jgi:hypothetical protein